MLCEIGEIVGRQILRDDAAARADHWGKPNRVKAAASANVADSHAGPNAEQSRELS